MELITQEPDDFSQTYFDCYDGLWNREEQKRYFVAYVKGLISETHRKNIQRVTEKIFETDYQSMHHFVAESPWNYQDMNECRLSFVENTACMPTKKGALIIDDSGIPKRGTATEGVRRQYIGQVGKIANGQVFVTSHLADSKRHIPFDIVPYIPPEEGDDNGYTKIDLALTLIDEAVRRGTGFRAVIADAWYGSNPRFLAEIEAKKLSFIVSIKKNRRVFFRLPGERVSTAHTLEEILTHLLKPELFRPVVLKHTDGTEETRYIASFPLKYKGVKGKRRTIVESPDPEKWEFKDLTIIVTNVIDMRDETVFNYYHLRNWIEVFYREIKDELGASDYQMRKLERIMRHWILCFVAYSLIQWLQKSGSLGIRLKKTENIWPDTCGLSVASK